MDLLHLTQVLAIARLVPIVTREQQLLRYVLFIYLVGHDVWQSCVELHLVLFAYYSSAWIYLPQIVFDSVLNVHVR